MAATVPQKKLESVLRMRLDSPALRDALDSVASFYGKDEKEIASSGNTLAARRELRMNLERKGLMISKQFLESFLGVKDRLDAMHQTVDALDRHCKNIEEHLEHAEETTSAFVLTAEKMREDKEELERRAEMVKRFLDKYQLSEKELITLRHAPLRAQDEGGPFFSALERVQGIRADSSELLGGPFQCAGLEILEELATINEAAIVRLYKWFKEHCQSVDKMEMAQDHPQAMGMLRRAVSILRSRREYLDDCLESVVVTRQTSLRRAFIRALTRGGPNGIPRPIELHAHDVTRYVSDMLAWVHVAVASEADALKTMFGIGESRGARGDKGGGIGEQSSTEEVEGVAFSKDAMHDALQGIFDGLTRPLSTRLVQSINEPQDMVVKFQTIDVLKFYAHTIGALLAPESRLVKSLSECCGKATGHFNTILKRYANDLTSNMAPFAANLSAVGPLVEAASRLKKMCMVHQSSMVPRGEKDKFFTAVLSAMVEPLRHMCMSATRGLDEDDTSIYMVNNLNVIVLSIAPFPFTEQWKKSIEQQIDSWLQTLVNACAAKFLNGCQLLKKVEIIRDIKSTIQSMKNAGIADTSATKPLSTYEGMDEGSVTASFAAFNNQLVSLGDMKLSKIDDSKIRSAGRTRFSKHLSDVYKMVYTEILSPGSGYGEGIGNTWYTPEKVESLLS
jgi:conserved oligomeric Golgi complex subunit 6